MRATAHAEPLSGQASFQILEPFAFESGAVLPDLRVAYETWGQLNPADDKAVLVVHALTGDAHAASGGSSGDPRPGLVGGPHGAGEGAGHPPVFRHLRPTARWRRGTGSRSSTIWTIGAASS